MSVTTLAVVLSSVLGLRSDVPIQRPGGTPTEPAAEAPMAPEATAPAAASPAPAEGAIEAPTAAADAAPAAAPPEPPGPQPEPTAPEPPPPTFDLEPDAPEPITIDLDDRDRKLRRASSLIAGGAVMVTAGLVMLIGAATEAAKPACKFDLDTCANAPRPAVARGLGVGAAIALVGGAALVGFGAHRRHKLNAAIAGDANAVALTVSGRF